MLQSNHIIIGHAGSGKATLTHALAQPTAFFLSESNIDTTWRDLDRLSLYDVLIDDLAKFNKILESGQIRSRSLSEGGGNYGSDHCRYKSTVHHKGDKVVQ